MDDFAKLIDGWKSVFVSLLVVVSSVFYLVTGHDMTPEYSSRLTQLATTGPLLAIAVYTVWDKIRKARKQSAAGATATELLSDIGHVKLAIADGVIPSVPITPTEQAVPIGPPDKKG